MVLPSTLTGASFPNIYHAEPIKIGSAIYVVAINGSSLAMYKSTDDGDSFSVVDGANEPAETNINCIAVAFDGTTIGVATATNAASADYLFHTFDTTLGADGEWDVKDESIETGITTDAANTIYTNIDLVARSDGSYVASYMGASENVSGTDYSRVTYAIRSTGGSWTTGLALDDGGADHYNMTRCVLGASDKTHFLYYNDDGNDIYHKSLPSGGSLSAAEQVNDANTFKAADVVGITAAYYDAAGTERLVVGFHAFVSSSNYYMAATIDNDGTPGSDSQASDTATYPFARAVMVADDTDDKPYLLYVDNATFDLFLAEGLGWGTDVELLDAVTVNFMGGASVITLSDNSRVIAYLYENGSTFTYNHYELAAGSTTYEGTGSGQVTFTGSGQSGAEKSGSASGTVSFSGSAAATAEKPGTSSDEIAFTGSGQSGAAKSGSASGQVTFTGSGQSGAEKSGSASGTVSFSGSAAATVEKPGTGSGEVTFTGSGQSGAAKSGSASGQVTFSGSAAATVEKPDTSSGEVTFIGSGQSGAEKSGSASGTVAFSGSAAATAEKPGAGSGEVTFTGSGLTIALQQGSASGIVTFTGSGQSGAEKSGSASGTVSFSGNAAATAEKVGTSSGEVTFSGSGQSGAEKSGSASGTVAFSGSAAATAEKPGTGSGEVTFSGSGLTIAQQEGSASGEVTFTGSGQSGTEKSGSASGTVSFSGNAAATAEKVGTSSGEVTFIGSGQATAQKPGTGTGTVTFTGSGIGTEGVIPDIVTSATILLEVFNPVTIVSETYQPIGAVLEAYSPVEVQLDEVDIMTVKGSSFGRKFTFTLNGVVSDPDELNIWFTKSGDTASNDPYTYDADGPDDGEVTNPDVGVYVFKLLNITIPGQYKLEAVAIWETGETWRQEIIETVIVGETIADMTGV